MNSAEKNTNQNTNEAQARQGREGVRESQGSVYVPNLWNSQRQHTARSIGLVPQDKQKQSISQMERFKSGESVSKMPPGLGPGDHKAYEFGYRSSIWRRHIPITGEFSTAASYSQGDISGLGRISVNTGGYLQETTETHTGRGMQPGRLYCYAVNIYRSIHRFWTKNKRGSRMIDIIERAVVFTLLVGLCILTWYVIITIGGNYV